MIRRLSANGWVRLLAAPLAVVLLLWWPWGWGK